MHRRTLLAAAPALATGLISGLARPAIAQNAPIRFGVGPQQPTPGDTRRIYEPFFAHLAKALGRPYELTATTEFAGIAVALATEQVDVAWMGPWSYVLAKDKSGCDSIGTVKYRGLPIYHAIIMSKPELVIAAWPDDVKGKSISFTEPGSTSGWLIPSYWFKSHGIDPRTYFQYREGATHAAQSIAVVSGQVDLATDYDRNLNAMVDAGKVKREQVKVVWESDPLPNDPLAARKGLDAEIRATILATLLAIDADTAKTVMPPNYTGWVQSKPDTYALIETAGRSLGKIG